MRRSGLLRCRVGSMFCRSVRVGLSLLLLVCEFVGFDVGWVEAYDGDALGGGGDWDGYAAVGAWPVAYYGVGRFLAGAGVVDGPAGDGPATDERHHNVGGGQQPVERGHGFSFVAISEPR